MSLDKYLEIIIGPMSIIVAIVVLDFFYFNIMFELQKKSRYFLTDDEQLISSFSALGRNWKRDLEKVRLRTDYSACFCFLTNKAIIINRYFFTTILRIEITCIKKLDIQNYRNSEYGYMTLDFVDAHDKINRFVFYVKDANNIGEKLKNILP